MKNSHPFESLFNTLKAENEPWLGDVFVSLPVFEQLRENRSAILYGEAGSGKSALRLELRKEQGDKILTVLWMPEPLLENQPSGTSLASQAMRQALRACVENLILEGNLPQRLGEPPDWVSSALQWFLRTYLPFDPMFYIQSQVDRLTNEETQWYLTLLDKTFPPLVNEQASINDQVRLLQAVLRQAKYDQLWLTIDGLERWTPHHAGEQVAGLLDAILSTLVVFDMPEVVYKFFVPATLKGSLHGTAGVERHRAEEVQLEWSVDDLQALVEIRLAYAFSTKKFSISMLCEGDEFLNWLKEFGGNLPRDWLKLAEPLITEYQKQGKRLSTKQGREVMHRRPPLLRLDHHRREVWVGRKRIPIGSNHEFRLMEYLYAHPGKICSLEELYYYAQTELDAIPDKGSEKWVYKDIWRPAMDTMIWRLRQKIEQNPKEPLYLITHHGKGLELLHANV
jgi:hypothetical protein